MSVELVFPSDTNQQLAAGALERQRIRVTFGRPGCLDIDRDELVAHLTQVEDTLADYSGHIWAD